MIIVYLGNTPACPDTFLKQSKLGKCEKKEYENYFQVNKDGLKLNGTHQLLAYADDVNTLERSIHTLKEKAEASVAATREIGLEVSADKTKYMVMSRDQNAGRNHSVRINNSTFERVEKFKYLGTTLTNQNSIAEEIKSRLRSGNACYHSVQKLLSSGCYPKI